MGLFGGSSSTPPTSGPSSSKLKTTTVGTAVEESDYARICRILSKRNPPPPRPADHIFLSYNEALKIATANYSRPARQPDPHFITSEEAWSIATHNYRTLPPVTKVDFGEDSTGDCEDFPILLSTPPGQRSELFIQDLHAGLNQLRDLQPFIPDEGLDSDPESAQIKMYIITETKVFLSLQKKYPENADCLDHLQMFLRRGRLVKIVSNNCAESQSQIMIRCEKFKNQVPWGVEYSF